MADSFLLSIAESVVGKLGSLALEEFFLAWGLESDLEKIKENLKVIKAVLLDAEQQLSLNPRIEIWLEKLKQVLYDAEDVVDEFECEALRRKVVKSGNTTRKVRRFFSSSNPLAFRFRMGHKLKQIRERVDEIAALKSKFGLTERIFDRPVIHREREMTHSFVDASDVIGRDQSRDNIIEMLQHVDGENVSIIPIVGIGGLGKTTLAKLVYNDQRVATLFELKLWVCVSDVFELDKVIIKILNSASPDKKYLDMGIDQLQRSLREALNGWKYLLILDDVWSEDPRKWHELKTLLMGGANGSKIVVTTRSNRVAEIMGTVSPQNLSLLPHRDCLSLFFKSIGEEIVRKCKGVPLAVITLGSLLYSVTDEREWEFIRDSEIWELKQKENDILPALRLSYEHLPSYLKRCFAYCSIFPKDYVLNDIELVYLWMANGLVQSSNENQELEDVGFRYFKELCSRCFFQDFSEYYGIVKCKMHDLIHDLALSITQNECSMFLDSTQQIAKSVRHVSFPNPESLPKDVPKSLQNLECMQTIYCFVNEREEGISSEMFIKTCCSRFQYLRALDLSYSSFEELPILLLYRCRNLQELPKDIRCMINLRFLWITTRQKYFPTGGIGCLKSLRFLFITGCYNLEYLFEDMQGLKKLRRLVVWDCESLISLPQSIKCLTTLDTLSIAGCDNLELRMEEGEETQFSLQRLELRWLPKIVDFSEWLIRGSTNSLKVLEVKRCDNLRELPNCLQNMASHPEVRIIDCPELNNDPLQKAEEAGPSTSLS
uniref:Disease resistance protein RGA3 n=2 Tax=Manihot esculenta TaxID=3983 RepID=A0A199UBJ3_MANES